jgi:hypothetical protein
MTQLVVCALQAQRALEERRAERARMDDLMRNPSQAPAPPKKPILRKGSGAVLRSPTRAAGSSTSCSHRPTTVPAQGTAAGAAAALRSPGTSPVTAATAAGDRERHEWAQGLEHFISCQRKAARPLAAVQVGCQQRCRPGRLGSQACSSRHHATMSQATKAVCWLCWMMPGSCASMLGGVRCVCTHMRAVCVVSCRPHPMLPRTPCHGGSSSWLQRLALRSCSGCRRQRRQQQQALGSKAALYGGGPA